MPTSPKQRQPTVLLLRRKRRVPPNVIRPGTRRNIRKQSRYEAVLLGSCDTASSLYCKQWTQMSWEKCQQKHIPTHLDQLTFFARTAPFLVSLSDVGLNPTMPQKEAGPRRDPATSVPIANGTHISLPPRQHRHRSSHRGCASSSTGCERDPIFCYLSLLGDPTNYT